MRSKLLRPLSLYLPLSLLLLSSPFTHGQDPATLDQYVSACRKCVSSSQPHYYRLEPAVVKTNGVEQQLSSAFRGICMEGTCSSTVRSVLNFLTSNEQNSLVITDGVCFDSCGSPGGVLEVEPTITTTQVARTTTPPSGVFHSAQHTTSPFDQTTDTVGNSHFDGENNGRAGDVEEGVNAVQPTGPQDGERKLHAWQVLMGVVGCVLVGVVGVLVAHHASKKRKLNDTDGSSSQMYSSDGESLLKQVKVVSDHPQPPHCEVSNPTKMMNKMFDTQMMVNQPQPKPVDLRTAQTVEAVLAKQTQPQNPWEALLNAASCAQPVPMRKTARVVQKSPPPQVVPTIGDAAEPPGAEVSPPTQEHPEPRAPHCKPSTEDGRSSYDRGYEDAMRQTAIAAARAVMAKMMPNQTVQEQDNAVAESMRKAEIVPPSPTLVPTAPVVAFQTPQFVQKQQVQVAPQQQPQVARGPFERDASPLHRSMPFASAAAAIPTVIKTQRKSKSPSPAPAVSAQTSAPFGLGGRLIRKDDVWQPWVLELGAKDRNDLIRKYTLTKMEGEDLKKASRRMKQNLAQQRYLKRQDAPLPAGGSAGWSGDSAPTLSLSAASSPRSSISPSPSPQMSFQAPAARFVPTLDQAGATQYQPHQFQQLQQMIQRQAMQLVKSMPQGSMPLGGNTYSAEYNGNADWMGLGGLGGF